jgi:hypothetical protein
MYLKNYLKIGTGLLISFIIVYNFSGVLFLGNTPTLRPHPEQYIASKVQSQVEILASRINTGGNKNSITTEEDYNKFMSNVIKEGTKQIAPGTYASENVVVVDTTNLMTTQNIKRADGTIDQIYVQSGRATLTTEELESALARIAENKRNR